MKNLLSKILLASVAAVALVATAWLLQPASSSAQTATGGDAIAPGPGGMWVLRGDRLYICREPLVRSAARAAEPPTPQCGQPARVP